MGEVVIAFMHAINSNRLCSSGHDSLNTHIAQLYTRFKGAPDDRGLLFLGCERDALYLEGTLHKAKEPQIQKFLAFFRFLRISRVLLQKELTAKELGSLIELLAGARQGQADEMGAWRHVAIIR